MIPATDLDNYRGTIFLNPGGPGGSGLGLIERTGANISRIVGPSFDVLSFDPRGIGRTTPQASCFETPSQRAIWATQEGHQLVDASDEALGIVHARAQVRAELCKERVGGEWGIGRFATTPYVARDMLEMSQLMGQDQLQYWGFVSAVCHVSVHFADTSIRVMAASSDNTLRPCTRTRSSVL